MASVEPRAPLRGAERARGGVQEVEAVARRGVERHVAPEALQRGGPPPRRELGERGSGGGEPDGRGATEEAALPELAEETLRGEPGPPLR